MGNKVIDKEAVKCELGDVVAWSSSAQGVVTDKVGRVVEVVEAGARPKTKVDGGTSLPRLYRSYVVRATATVRRTGKRKSERTYWPNPWVLEVLKKASEVA